MAIEVEKKDVAKIPLRLMPSVKRIAKAYSEKEGVSLNQFVNVAVAEKLAHLQHEEWMQNRAEPTSEGVAWALKLLQRPSKNPVEPGDELPAGYRSKLR